ncbi:MAG: AAA family ATPase [Succinatimonas hippei]|nr:AAA family ATPase [Succinatimonas hippei]
MALKGVAGTDDYAQLRGLNCYYVDKTPFLKTIFEDDHNSVLLITRPRRFGKTLTMSMFESFLSVNAQDP